MNEPGISVAFVILGVLLATPVLLALVVALYARRGARAVWMAWGIGFVLFLAIAGPTASIHAAHAEDARMFAGLIVGTGVATAAAAWVVNRKQRARVAPDRLELARSAVLTAVGVMIVVMSATC